MVGPVLFSDHDGSQHSCIVELEVRGNAHFGSHNTYEDMGQGYLCGLWKKPKNDYTNFYFAHLHEGVTFRINAHSEEAGVLSMTFDTPQQCKEIVEKIKVSQWNRKRERSSC